jgi:hypothetical protein
MMNRGLVRETTLEEFAAHPHVFHEGHHDPAREESMYEPWKYTGNAWGMAVDLGA